MKYKSIIFAALLCLFIFLSSCAPTLVNTSSSLSSDLSYVQPLSFEEALESSTHIVFAEYKSIKTFIPDNDDTEDNTSLLLLTFSPAASTEQIKGSKINGDFTVSVPSSRIGNGISLDFEIGKSYWLVLERRVAVYREDIFCQMSFWELPSDMGVQDLKTPYVREYLADKEASSDFVGNDYVKSTDLSDIVSASPIVVKVKIRTIQTDNVFGAVICNCTVSDVLKGEAGKGTVLSISFPKGSELQTRKEYIVLLDEQHDLSSKNSIYSVKDAEAVAKIQELTSSK